MAHKDEAAKAAYDRAYREQNAEKLSAKNAAYYRANRKRLLTKATTYREANREMLATKQRIYNQTHHEKIKAQRETNREERNAKGRLRYWKNPAKAAAKAKAYNETHREQLKAYREANRDHYKHNHLKREFGITLVDFNRMLDSQHHTCALCHTPDYHNGRSLHVDHCHTTGVIRGLLCTNCNRGLGHLKESPALLKKAAAYVAAYRTDYELPG